MKCRQDYKTKIPVLCDSHCPSQQKDAALEQAKAGPVLLVSRLLYTGLGNPCSRGTWLSFSPWSPDGKGQGLL